MLKSAQTWIASTSASSETPAARTASASARVDLIRLERQLLEEAERRTRGASSTGAVRQSRRTASQTSSPSAYDATAPWAFVQNTHWLSDDTNAANSSRSPSLQSDGPRNASSSASEYGRPKSSGR